jgi:hypothetical protein
MSQSTAEESNKRLCSVIQVYFETKTHLVQWETICPADDWLHVATVKEMYKMAASIR